LAQINWGISDVSPEKLRKAARKHAILPALHKSVRKDK
jgi:hypothetical protein